MLVLEHGNRLAEKETAFEVILRHRLEPCAGGNPEALGKFEGCIVVDLDPHRRQRLEFADRVDECHGLQDGLVAGVDRQRRSRNCFMVTDSKNNAVGSTDLGRAW